MAAAITDRTRVVIVCSPNNPTSTIVTAAEFEAFMAAVPPTVLVLLDEAYLEFVTDPDAVDGIRSARRATRTSSCCAPSRRPTGSPACASATRSGRRTSWMPRAPSAIPLSVTEPAQRAAIASLEHEPELLERVAELVARRDRIWAGLVEQGWRHPAAAGQLRLAADGRATTAAAAEVLEAHGIVARAFVPDGIRVSIGEAESVEKLLSAAAEVVQTLRTDARRRHG